MSNQCYGKTWWHGSLIVAMSSMQALWINIGLICYHNKPLSVQFLLFLDLSEKSKKKRKKHGYMLFSIYCSHFSLSQRTLQSPKYAAINTTWSLTRSCAACRSEIVEINQNILESLDRSEKFFSHNYWIIVRKIFSLLRATHGLFFCILHS